MWLALFWFLFFVFASFVRELHQQLVSCMNRFVDDLRKYQAAQEAKINDRSSALRKEMSDAQQILADIDLLLQSKESIAVSGVEVINRCDQFFRNCVDVVECDDDFSYLDFVQAGRLYVRSEHLGYLRLCDATPEDVELKRKTGEQAVCNRELAVVLETNRANCINAEPYLKVQLTDDQGVEVPIKMVNNNNGSYNIVFTPTRPGMHQLNVQLFGITLGCSPMQISVASEPVSPRQPAFRPANSTSSGSMGVSCASSQNKSSGISNNQLDSSAAMTSAARCLENFDDSDYFAMPASPHSVVRSSPGSASMGRWSVPVKQAEKYVPDPQDHGDDEEVRGSMMRMSLDATTAGNRAGGWQSHVIRTQVDDSAAARNALPSYCAGAFLEFEDLTYEEQQDFDSTGLNYYHCSAGGDVFVFVVVILCCRG